MIDNWTPLDIAKWHEKTFPDTSLTGQKAKLQEEKQEWRAGHNIDELADCYIVACGLLRFPSKDAAVAFHFVEEQWREKCSQKIGAAFKSKHPPQE